MSYGATAKKCEDRARGTHPIRRVRVTHVPAAKRVAADAIGCRHGQNQPVWRVRY
jgi:hypothetical protein